MHLVQLLRDEIIRKLEKVIFKILDDNYYDTTGRKTIENSEFPIEFSMSLEGVSVLRTNCTKLY